MTLILFCARQWVVLACLSHVVLSWAASGNAAVELRPDPPGAPVSAPDGRASPADAPVGKASPVGIPALDDLAAAARRAEGLPAPAENFRLVTTPGFEALALDSTLAGSRQDGLLLYAWLPLSGYVQVAPARMDYLERSGQPTARVRIGVPVRKRPWVG